MSVPNTPTGSTPEGTPPTAAATVSGADLSEADAGELLRLQNELEEERGRTKKRELRIAELEDQVNALKSGPAPAPKKSKDWFSEL